MAKDKEPHVVIEMSVDTLEVLSATVAEGRAAAIIAGAKIAGDGLKRAEKQAFADTLHSRGWCVNGGLRVSIVKLAAA